MALSNKSKRGARHSVNENLDRKEEEAAIERSKKPLRIMLDSSFLFIPSQFKMDIFEELKRALNRSFKLIMSSPTYKEVQRIARDRSPKLKRQAIMALKYAAACQIIDVKKEDMETHDDLIVRLASEMKCAVATNDGALRRRLRGANVPVIYLRQKSRLAIDGAV